MLFNWLIIAVVMKWNWWDNQQSIIAIYTPWFLARAAASPEDEAVGKEFSSKQIKLSKELQSLNCMLQKKEALAKQMLENAESERLMSMKQVKPCSKFVILIELKR